MPRWLGRLCGFSLAGPACIGAYLMRFRPSFVKVARLLLAVSFIASAIPSNSEQLPESPLSFPDVVDSVRPSIVAIGAAYPKRQPIGDRPRYRVSGSGFALDDGSLIITNLHVLPKTLDAKNREFVAVFVGRGREAEVRLATVRGEDQANDLALLQIEGEPLHPLSLNDDRPVREGEAVAVTGYPIGAVLGFFPATHRGYVAALTPLARAADRGRQLSAVQIARLRDPYPVLQLDMIAYPGNSGSPVYRVDDGKVVGVVNSVFVKDSRESALTTPSAITYAIPIEPISKLLESVQLERGDP